MGDALNASPWLPLPHDYPWSRHGLRETLLGGQSFRWEAVGDDTYEGIWLRHLIRLRWDETARMVLYRVPPGAPHVPISTVRHYLADDLPWGEIVDALPWRSDLVLRAALQAFSGLRLLRQPIAEVLLGFIASSNKQILQIQQICAELARRFGPPLWPGAHFHALPSWETLANCTEDDLRRCRLGYRARYILQTAQFLSPRNGWLDAVSSLPCAQARAELMSLPGVGGKVADCVLLFGAQKLEAFPVDTWIERILRCEYAMADMTPRQLLHFARIHFGPASGLAQQFLFARARQQPERIAD